MQVWEEGARSSTEGHAEYLGPKLDGSFAQYYDSGVAVLNIRFQVALRALLTPARYLLAPAVIHAGAQPMRGVRNARETSD
jgi:hypothetical protein